jgi:mannose-1-phosphate guanylyltransferase
VLWAIVMAGGAGTRLWPLSSDDRPKPLLDLFKGEKTLLEETFRRLSPLIPPSRIYLIGNQNHVAQLRRSAKRVPKSQVLGEPASRNTGPTVALGAELIRRRDPNAVILMTPADHRIPNRSKFQATVRDAVKSAKKTHSFCVFGLMPGFASSSYGYIETGKRYTRNTYELIRFIEKPSVKRAKTFIRSKRYFWHAGIFMAEANTILDAVEKHAPAVYRGVKRLSLRGAAIQPARSFAKLPNISFDYAVLEHLERATLIRCDFEFSDVGTWQGLHELWPKDRHQNAAISGVAVLDAENNLVYAKDKRVCLNRVRDLVIIDTPEVLFVSQKSSAEELRRVVRHFAKHNGRS